MTQPFYFPDGRLAHNAEDLLELCQQDPDAGINFLVKQDLEQWLAYIGSYELAECAANARQTELEDRQKLEEFINRSHSLTRSQAVPAAVTQTPSAQNLTATESAGEQPEETVDTSTPEQATEASVNESKQLAAESAGEQLEEMVDTSTPEQATKPAVEESKQLAQVESTLNENQEESLESPMSTPEQATAPAVEDSKQLAQVESKLQNKSGESPAPTPDKTTSESEPQEKLSFFQVIAKFIVKILYRNKA